MNQSMDMAQTAYQALDEKLGEDIKVLQIDEVSVMADYLVIANGNSSTQIMAMANSVQQKMSEKSYVLKQVEGNRNATWTLMDYGDVIVHIFSKEDRLFYDLERIWRDGKEITMNA